MLGRKLVERIARDTVLAGEAISRALLVDMVEPQPLAGANFDVETVVSDLTEP
jgi:hypothetical protein